MGFLEALRKTAHGRQKVEPHGEAVSADADVSWRHEELFGLQYVMRAFFVISLPVLIGMVIYNLLNDRPLEAVLESSMAILLLWSYSATCKSGDQSLLRRNSTGSPGNLFPPVLKVAEKGDRRYLEE